MSKVLTLSKEAVHESMLQSYGTLLKDEDELVGFSTEKPCDPVKTEIHCKLRGTSDLNGKTFYHYYMIKGSRFYDSKEMSQLINGTVEEAKQLDIETMTPEELARLRYE